MLRSKPFTTAGLGQCLLHFGCFLSQESLACYSAQDSTTLCQNLMQHFWQRWSSEYLQQLQHLQKWKTPQRTLQQGDLVIICEDTPFTNHWPLARVIATFLGKDGKVRVTQVTTATSILKQPVAKLSIVLPGDHSPQELGKATRLSGGSVLRRHCLTRKKLKKARRRN